MLVFLDTEFTDFKDPDLISLGMSSVEGDFYAENGDFKREQSTEWVVENIYPLLDLPKYGKRRSELAAAVWEYLDSFDDRVIILVDYHKDARLLMELFNWEKHPNIQDICNIYQTFAKSPDIVREYSKFEQQFKDEFDKFFILNPTHTQHHALSDAIANRLAFETVIKDFNEKDIRYV